MTVAVDAGRTAVRKRAASAAAKGAPVDLVASGTSTTGQPMRRPKQSAPKPLSALTPEEEPKDEPKDEADGESEPSDEPSGRGMHIPLPQSGVAKDSSWAILGFLLWGWVVMPFLEGGLPGMKKVLVAKFFNKKPDGSFYE